MFKTIFTVLAAAALAAGAPVAASAGTSGHHKRLVRHNVAPPGKDITSFSSSSVLHVGVNHPPKNR
jgi:hypothetical protein